jgi:transposase-like protein
MTFIPGKEVPGDFADVNWTPCPDMTCRKCAHADVARRKWESSCGGWEDWQYQCHHCDYTWWVEGIDS